MFSSRVLEAGSFEVQTVITGRYRQKRSGAPTSIHIILKGHDHRTIYDPIRKRTVHVHNGERTRIRETYFVRSWWQPARSILKKFEGFLHGQESEVHGGFGIGPFRLPIGDHIRIKRQYVPRNT